MTKFKVLFVTTVVGVGGHCAVHSVVAEFDTEEEANVACARCAYGRDTKAIALF